MARELKSELQAHYQKLKNQTYEFKPKSISERYLKNTSLYYLTRTQDPNFYQQAYQQFQEVKNMTDTMGALSALNDVDCVQRQQALDEFYQKWQKESLVVDKWLSLQALSILPGALDRVKALLKHPAFDRKNPNRVRSLVGAFCCGNIHFHDPSGSGYEFLTEQVLNVDKFNPNLSARLLEPFTRWRKFDQNRRQLMKKQLEKISSTPDLSNDVYELVDKSLKD